jgi:hypothetical protein
MNQNQEMIQLLIEEGEYAPMYPFVAKSNLSDFQKILVSHMLNDIRMNGTITWKHETYASKLNASRMGVCKQFQKLTEAGIIIPEKDNKAGSKNNKFSISFSAISDYVVVKADNDKHKADNEEYISDDNKADNQEHKADNQEHKADNQEHKADNDEHKADTRRYHIKKIKETNKETNKEIIKGLVVDTTDDTSFINDIDIEYDLTPLNYKRPNNYIDLKEDPTPEELDTWLSTLDLKDY